MTTPGDPWSGSVWTTGQDSPRTQRRDYPTATKAHPAKMLPAIAHHAITAYTQPGDIVLDPMCGIGTTLIEALRAGRHAIGVEYEPRWATIATEAIAETRPPGLTASITQGDARKLDKLVSTALHGRVALVLTSPPYGPSLHGNVKPTPGTGIHKSDDTYGTDRTNLAYLPLHAYTAGLTEVFTHCHTLLRPGGILAITARPIRRNGTLIDIPGLITTAAIAAGFHAHERNTALLAAWQDGHLTARPSFFALDNARKANAKGVPATLITHEDVLVYMAAKGSPLHLRPPSNACPRHAPALEAPLLHMAVSRSDTNVEVRST
ncbi:hypothetical protein Afil01_31160 [Actinorhabdospora filicis]|uniref:Methyltransferase n=1 Tax=Actinorhabdospora filicis TaxID=1785913 RepID=A0A9W6SM45_9ACTN|nr:DNA methyltransferase [Actinorhabdospora filicis]GLZ78309.1 hypothetical protein Afil01_31160 [Actinorhabdospora filicis]